MTSTHPAVDVAWRKSVRAMQTARQLDIAVEEFAASEPFRVEVQSDGKERLRFTNPPPTEIAIIAGEILYQVRSSLDHLFYALIERNHPSAVLPATWERDSQFPLMIKRPDGAPTSGALERKDFLKSKVLDALTDRAFQFIEANQPYQPSIPGADQHLLLRLLTKLSNIDKHRRLNTSVTRITRSEKLVTPEGYTSTSLEIMLNDGDLLGTAWHSDEMRSRAVKTNRELKPEVMFDEPELGPPQEAPIENLTELPRLMLSWLIPHMADLISKP